MSKNTSPPKSAPTPKIEPWYSKSTFTLTFVIELLDIEVFHDCHEGWIDLGPCLQGFKIQYQLYYGHSFDVDILIWPHTAKILSGQENCWVRTFLYLERRWLAFSIRHCFPVRVADLRVFEAMIYPRAGMENLSSHARSDKNHDIYIPELQFGDRRYFAPVMSHIDSEERARNKFIKNLVLEAAMKHIPPSHLDGKFNVPQRVTDVRHQDAAVQYIQDTTFNRKFADGSDEDEPGLMKEKSTKSVKSVKSLKPDSKGKKQEPRNTFYLSLTGNAILAGAGRVVPFQNTGKRYPNMGAIAAFIGSNNVPPDDDVPILFVNVENLFNVPVKEFEKYKISELYIKWILGQEAHESSPKPLKCKQYSPKTIKIGDHHAVPLDPDLATEVTATFLDDAYEIQLRGKIHTAQSIVEPKFFGYDKADKDYDKYLPPKKPNEDELSDTLIAVTKIDAKQLAKGIQAFIRGEYSLYPITPQIVLGEREAICTNDMNGVRAKVKPTTIVPSSLILKAHMTLEVSMGVVGCKPPRLIACFSRLFCLVRDTDTTMAILMKIKDINETECVTDCEHLTGFAIDTGDVVAIFLEGPRDGRILHVWEHTADYYPKVKPMFSSSARYSSRVYPELVETAVPFVIMKMFVPLTAALACPPIYVKPALPLPTKSAALKLGRLIGSKLRTIPTLKELPTLTELQSFRLELCAPPRPPATTLIDNININMRNEDMQQAAVASETQNQQLTDTIASTPGRINWSSLNSSSTKS